MLTDVSLTHELETTALAQGSDSHSTETENRPAKGILYGVLGGGLLWLAVILAKWL